MSRENTFHVCNDFGSSCTSFSVMQSQYIENNNQPQEGNSASPTQITTF